MKDGEHYTVYVDASYVVNGINARTLQYSKGCNGDIWTRIFREAERLGSLNVIKVKSHVESKADWERYAMTRDAYLYNAGADRIASGAANNMFARSHAERQSDTSHWWETYRAAQRIATIEASIRSSGKAMRRTSPSLKRSGRPPLRGNSKKQLTAPICIGCSHAKLVGSDATTAPAERDQPTMTTGGKESAAR